MKHIKFFNESLLTGDFLYKKIYRTDYNTFISSRKRDVFSTIEYEKLQSIFSRYLGFSGETKLGKSSLIQDYYGELVIIKFEDNWMTFRFNDEWYLCDGIEGIKSLVDSRKRNYFD